MTLLLIAAIIASLTGCVALPTLRRKNVRNVRGRITYSGNTNAPAKIAEIELYGFVSESNGASTVTQTSTSSTTEEELDEIDLFLK